MSRRTGFQGVGVGAALCLALAIGGCGGSPGVAGAVFKDTHPLPADTLTVLRESWRGEGVFHCFTGNAEEAREQFARYLSLPDARLKTVAAWRRMAYSQHPAYLALRERIYRGLQDAGMPIS